MQRSRERLRLLREAAGEDHRGRAQELREGGGGVLGELSAGALADTQDDTGRGRPEHRDIGPLGRNRHHHVVVHDLDVRPHPSHRPLHRGSANPNWAPPLVRKT